MLDGDRPWRNMETKLLLQEGNKHVHPLTGWAFPQPFLFQQSTVARYTIPLSSTTDLLMMLGRSAYDSRFAILTGRQRSPYMRR